LIRLQIPILDIAGGPFPDLTARAKSTAYPQQLHGCQVDFAVSCRKDAERPWTYRALDAAAIAAMTKISVLHPSQVCSQLAFLRIKKEAMAKVVEYLKYHVEHECSEIRIPLTGDNLQDCGATRWDSSFVNVDRELLFDLTVAASYLDIASLWLLLSAKAALMTNNKSSEKLRKDFCCGHPSPVNQNNTHTQTHTDMYVYIYTLTNNNC
jgi:hypothetical protein